MKKSTLLTVFVFLALSGFAQTATEAFRLSDSDPVGTARNLGVANSMYTIGPDFSAISTNPAGIGGYWKSEFTGTIGLNLAHLKARLTGDALSQQEQDYNHFRLPNLGFIVAMQPNGGRWNTSNWAIGINRMADFDKEIHFSGNTLGSITDSWKEKAEGLNPEDLNGFEEGLAYTSGAIYDFEKDNHYETDYSLNPQYLLHKEERSTVRGGKSELFLGYGANLQQKLLIGFSINLPLVNSTENRLYTEADGADDQIPFFNSLSYTSYINTTGYGFNGKFGLIAKPSKYFNVAVAIQTPTKFHLTDDYNTTVTYDFTEDQHDGPIKSESPYGSFQYALRTPWQFTGGIGIIAGQNGFISVGAKWADYSTMKYDYSVRGNGNAYNQEERKVNTAIAQQYGDAVEFNIGGELAIQYFRLRGGVTFSQSAYLNDDSFDPAYHAGLGFRDENFFVDFGYRLGRRDEGYLPYETSVVPQPLAVLKYTEQQLLCTVGMKF